MNFFNSQALKQKAMNQLLLAQFSDLHLNYQTLSSLTRQITQEQIQLQANNFLPKGHTAFKQAPARQPIRPKKLQ
jgi:hypothetical protein